VAFLLEDIGSFVPETLDLPVMPISTADAAFRSMYGQMCRFATRTKLIPEAMDLIAKAILKHTLHPPDFAKDDFIAPICWTKDFYASMIRALQDSDQEHMYRSKYNGLVASWHGSQHLARW
jgi:hypothetical protein